MDSEIILKDYIDIKLFKQLQEMYEALTGMQLQCLDCNGRDINGAKPKVKFCGDLVQCSAIGSALCERCAIYGMKQAQKLGKPYIYICHTGLIGFVYPIFLEDKIVGALSSGQVALRPLSESSVKENAKEYEIDENGLWKAAKKVPIKSKADIEKAAAYLFTQANILSQIISGKSLEQKATVQIENNSNVKSDFLANMSHEIRTPMNAVIGMAEMALREDMTPAARDYIGQIKSSGRALLNIINDILDFSKIEAGKMELSCVEYEPLSLINDVSLIVMTRLTDKPVELLLDVDPNIPHTLYGDDLRIRQILINLANNATKFTKQGHVMLKVRYAQTDNENIRLLISVIDTGIGIRKEDIGKLFSSFQQVDSKRNRNVEGTGLGLAITKNLVTMMNGQIHIDSEYEVGSTFTLDIPQRVIDDTPSIKLKNPERFALAGFFSREDVAEDFVSDSKKLGVYADDLSASFDPNESIKAWQKLHKNQKTYVIVDEKMLDNYFREYFSNHLDSESGALLLAESFSDVKKWDDMPYVQIIKKPFSVLNIAGLLEADSCRFNSSKASAEADFHFVAPKAKILIVDDNAINLSVAEGLLEPLKMTVDTAISGKEAIEKIESAEYDIIFMDHMMPELDGIETTRIIRRLYPNYKNVPIIALTANAISGTKEMFISEGMNDFVAKPIEVRLLISKVNQWLPKDKIIKLSEAEAEQNSSSEQEKNSAGEKEIPLSMGDLDIKAAFALLGTQKLFWKVFKDYYRVIDTKADLIEKYYNEQNWKNYVVEVHALKSSSKQIGAMELSAVAAELEAAGNALDIEKIKAKTADMLVKYRSYVPVLAPYCEEEQTNIDKAEISRDALEELFKQMLEAVDNLDMDEMERVIGQMDEYSFGESRDKFVKLKDAVADIDVDACEAIINTWFD